MRNSTESVTGGIGRMDTPPGMDDESLDGEDDGEMDERKGSGKGKPRAKSQQSRKAQNRIAQREFRQRKQQYVRDLEAKVELYSANRDEQIAALRLAVDDLTEENKKLRGLLASLAGFIQEGFGGCLKRLGLGQSEFDDILNRNESDTLYNSFQKYKTGATTSQGQGPSSAYPQSTSAPLHQISPPGISQSPQYPVHPDLVAHQPTPPIPPEAGPSTGGNLKRKRASTGASTLDDTDSGKRKRQNDLKALSHIASLETTSEGPRSTNPHQLGSFDSYGRGNETAAATMGSSPPFHLSPTIMTRPAPGSSSSVFQQSSHNPIQRAQSSSGHPDTPSPGSSNGGYYPPPPHHAGIIPSSSSAPAFSSGSTSHPSYMPSVHQHQRQSPSVTSLPRTSSPRSTFANSSNGDRNGAGTGPDSDSANATSLTSRMSNDVINDNEPADMDFRQLYGLCTDNPKLQAMQMISYHMANKRSDPNYHLPPSLCATEVQKRFPHNRIIDGIIWSELRDQLILQENTYAVSVLVGHLIECTEIHREDILDPSNWELTEKFLEDYWWLMTPEVLQTCNFWRKERGEPELTLESLAARGKAKGSLPRSPGEVGTLGKGNDRPESARSRAE